MSRYAELAEEFFTRYEEPELDELTIGFSGVDPPLKVQAAEIDHEKLDGLLGGDVDGHYHLTKELWQYVIELLNTHDFDGGFASTTELEYLQNEDFWYDGGFADTDDYEYELNIDKWPDGGDA